MATMAQKLQLRPGQRLALRNAPEGYAGRLASALEGISVFAEAGNDPDAVLLFVNNLAETTSLAPQIMHTSRPDVLLWIAYPKQASAQGASKGKTDVNRDRLWEALQGTGWRPVRQVALDDVWSALRFRPQEQVGR